MKKKLLLVGVSIFIAITLSELLMGIFNIVPDYKYYPGLFESNTDYDYALKKDNSVVQGDIPIYINSDGLRGSLYSTPKSETRIVILGDSFAFGYGVIYEESFAGLLEKCLLDTGNNVKVINASIPGFSTWHQYQFLKFHLTEMKPDLIILNIVENDRNNRQWLANPGGTLTPKGLENIRNPVVELLFNNPILSKNLSTYRLIKNIARNILYANHRKGLDGDITKAWKKSLSYVDKIAALCSEPKVQFLIYDTTNIPYVYNELSKRNYAIWKPSVHLGNEYKLPSNGHLNAQGHYMWFKDLIAIITENVSNLTAHDCQ